MTSFTSDESHHSLSITRTETNHLTVEYISLILFVAISLGRHSCPQTTLPVTLRRNRQFLDEIDGRPLAYPLTRSRFSTRDPGLIWIETAFEPKLVD